MINVVNQGVLQGLRLVVVGVVGVLLYYQCKISLPLPSISALALTLSVQTTFALSISRHNLGSLSIAWWNA